ncbi:MAG: Crp/Fnr family transcriptional regulator [Hyphomicrobiales bacterium]
MREYSIGSLIDIGSNIAPEFVELMVRTGTRRSFEKGDRIYSQGERATHSYFLLSGQAKSVLINAVGNECLLRIHLPHSFMGLTALSSAAVREADGIAIEDGELVGLEAREFQGLLAANPAFSQYIIRLLVNRMSDFHHRVGDFLVQNVEQRLAQVLLSLSRPDPEHSTGEERHPIKLTHEELATLLNARRPTITAILRRFEADGLIGKKRRQLYVLNAERLAHLLPRQPAPVRQTSR